MYTRLTGDQINFELYFDLKLACEQVLSENAHVKIHHFDIDAKPHLPRPGDDPKAPADEEFKELPENVENSQVFQLEGDDDFLIDITSGLLSAMLPHVNVSSRT